MKRFRDLSIRYKLTALTSITTTLALAVCCLIFVSNDIRMMRRSKIDQLTAIAGILSQNSSAALSLRNQESATSLLASLSERRTITAAWMLDDASEVFAQFSREPTAVCPPLAEGQYYRYGGDDSLIVWARVVAGDHTLGMIVIQDSLEDLHDSINHAIMITAVVLVICVTIGLSVALPLNRLLSRPILELAMTAQQVSLESGFHVRAQHQTRDEVGVLYQEFNAMLTRIQDRDDVIRRVHHDLQQSNDRLEERVHQRTRMLELANQKLKREMRQSELASTALKQTQVELIAASRKAGMADVANNVLHNVGNVLNSLNVSAAIINQRVREMRICKLQQCIGMIFNHPGDLGAFFSHDEKGSIIPKYLPNLVDHITADQQQLLCELESLTKNVQHIKDIVRAQQSHAGEQGLIDYCKPHELMDDALQFSIDSIKRHGITLVRQYEDIPDVPVEKARLLQILVNLIKNAKESVLSQANTKKNITLGVRLRDDRHIQYLVKDTGIGIERSELAKIFSHGFTTKAGGHGFGLHASANFARQMGGELTASSEGAGMGATFTIELPYEPQSPPTRQVRADTVSSV